MPVDVLLTFPCNGKTNRWNLTREQVAAWSTMFPGVDIEQQCRSAWAWVDASPTRRKTARGMKRFLSGWLARTNDRGGGGGGGQLAPRVKPPNQTERIRQLRIEAEEEQAKLRLVEGQSDQTRSA